MIDSRSSLMSTPITLIVYAVRSVPAETLAACSWLVPFLQEAVHIVKMNRAARLSERDTMPAFMMTMCLSAMFAIVEKMAVFRPKLLESDVMDALEYACLHDFSVLGKSVSAEAAGTLVALVGKNEGGMTLSRATVNAVMTGHGLRRCGRGQQWESCHNGWDNFSNACGHDGEAPASPYYSYSFFSIQERKHRNLPNRNPTASQDNRSRTCR